MILGALCLALGLALVLVLVLARRWRRRFDGLRALARERDRASAIDVFVYVHGLRPQAAAGSPSRLDRAIEQLYRDLLPPRVTYDAWSYLQTPVTGAGSNHVLHYGCALARHLDEHWRGQRVLLFGHSFGGLVALEAARHQRTLLAVRVVTLAAAHRGSTLLRAARECAPLWRHLERTYGALVNELLPEHVAVAHSFRATMAALGICVDSTGRRQHGPAIRHLNIVLSNLPLVPFDGRLLVRDQMLPDDAVATTVHVSPACHRLSACHDPRVAAHILGWLA